MENLSNFAYSYRIDMSHNEHNEKELVKYVTHPDVIAYMFAREVKPIGNIPHYQGIIWFKTKRTSKEETHYRNFKKKPFVRRSKGKGDGPVSFKIAKCCKSLAQYCNDKESLGLLKSDNITPKMLKELGKWNSKEEHKKQLNLNREKVYEKFRKNFERVYEQDTIGSHNPHEDYDYLWSRMAEVAYDTFINSKFNPPMKRHIPNLLKNILTKSDYMYIVYHVKVKSNKEQQADDLMDEEIQSYIEGEDINYSYM